MANFLLFFSLFNICAYVRRNKKGWKESELIRINEITL